MLSVLNRGKVYPVSEDISEIDLDTDVEEYNYDGRLVYRGNLDETHSTSDISVYWLYDDSSKRVGLAEHTTEKHVALWFRDNPYSTLFQEDWEPYNKTVWSLMNQYAYEDCMKYGWTTVQKVAERTGLKILVISDFLNKSPEIERCTRCLSSKQEGCFIVKKTDCIDVYTTLFVDEDGIIFVPPSDSAIFEKVVDNVQPILGTGD
jgi:hypothetical protein